MKLFHFGLYLSLMMFSIKASSQFVIGNDDIPQSVIFTSTPDHNTAVAANILQRFVYEISGAKLQIVKTVSKKNKNLIILDNQHSNQKQGIKEDGYRIKSESNKITISASGDKGIIYGVIDILEKYGKVKYFSEFQYVVAKNPTINIPNGDYIENPSFSYRQTQFYGIQTDSMYKYWHRLETPQEIFTSNYWVHTFEKILPFHEYGTTHPEYFSFFNNKRHPGKASQWCLTNENLFEEVCHKLDQLFRKDHTKKTISVSQNDSNFTNCTCDKCSAIDHHNGSPAGSLITFMNKVAKRFPDKTISTLAYLYSMPPPSHVKPLPNVNVMLCSIDANREVALTKNTSGQQFVKALNGWADISENIFVWDYGINFDNYLSPFPNFHVLKDNMKLFHKNKTTMHFSQIGGPRGCNFAELRAYMVSKLMWNVDVDAEVILKEFVDGYYGDAGKYIYEYIKIMEGALLASGKPLWIYDSPVTHKNGMLNTHLLEKYEAIFENAELAVKDDSLFLSRVHIAKLPILYSYLEISRTQKSIAQSAVTNRLSEFEAYIKKYQILTLNERNNSPEEYSTMYKTRYLNREEHLASGKKIKFFIEPQNKYGELAKPALTDGMYGGSSFVESWVGWEGTDAAFVIDLEKNTTINTVTIDFLHQLGSWILLPKKVSVSSSSDGVSFQPLETIEVKEDQDARVKFVPITVSAKTKVEGRYIKIEVDGTKICPPWHYGVGRTCWLFMDEVVVK